MEVFDSKVVDNDMEVELLGRVATGDRAAFETLYGLFYKRLYRFAYRILGQEEGIQEVINDTMFVVWDKAHRFDGSSKASTWLFGIALRKAKTFLTKHGAWRSAAESMGDLDDRFTHDWQGRLETANWLEAGMERLSPEQRAVVELTYFHGLHYREIGEILGCPENTVKTRMFYARDKLKTALRHLSRETDERQRRRGNTHD